MAQIDFISILNIPALLLLGVVTSYQDLKEKKIRNKWVVISILYAFFSLGLSALLYWRAGTPMSGFYVKSFFINLAFSAGFGILLWLSKLWNAGDAKLFVAYAALIPLSIYKWQVSALFPSYILLINTFTPIFVFLMVKMIARLKPKVVWEELKRSFAPKVILSFGLFIFGFSLFNLLIFRLTGVQPGFIFSILMLLLVMVFFTNALKVDLMKVSIALAVLRLVLEYKAVLTLGFWALFGLQLLVFLLLRYFVLNLGARVFSKAVYVEDLKPGMCLAYDMWEDKGKLKFKNTVAYSYLQGMFQAFDNKSSVLSDYSCLTKEDIENLKKSHSEGKLEEHAVLIYDKLSFAIFMFSGALVTLIVQGDLLVAIRLAVERFI